MELGADNGTSDGALLGHATVVVLLGSADGATVGTATAALTATDGILLGIEPGIDDSTSDVSVKSVQMMMLQMVHCLVSSLVQQMVMQMRCFVRHGARCRQWNVIWRTAWPCYC